jgi:hypothetical protein
MGARQKRIVIIEEKEYNGIFDQMVALGKSEMTRYLSSKTTIV